MSNKPIFILEGPAGVGKTLRAQAIKAALGCDRIVDAEWDILPGSLGLCNAGADVIAEILVQNRHSTVITIKVPNRESLDALTMLLERRAGRTDLSAPENLSDPLRRAQDSEELPQATENGNYVLPPFRFPPSLMKSPAAACAGQCCPACSARKTANPAPDKAQ